MNYVNPQYLVEPQWLNDKLDDTHTRVFDVTGMLTSALDNVAEKRHFALGHIPGATFFDAASAKGALSNPQTSLPWMWPSQEQFSAVMSSIGVSDKTHVVLYAATPRPGVDNGTMWCTRVWWILHHMGVNCAILNGGWERWVAEGYRVSTDHTDYPPTAFHANQAGLQAIVDKSELVTELADSHGTCVVDALSSASYAGQDKVRYGDRKGHITGAVNLPMSELLDPSTGNFLSANALSQRLEAAGLLSANRVVTYCGGGIAATVDAFCLALMGHSNVAIYDGSLFEWAADATLPMTDPSE